MKTAIELLAYMIKHPEESFASLVDSYDALTTEDQLKIKSVFKAVENMNIVPASEGEQGLNRPKTALELMGYMVKNPSVAFEDLTDVYDVLSEEEKFTVKAALSRIPASSSKELSYDYEKADREVEAHLETPEGKAQMLRLRGMLKNDNPAEKSIQGVAGDFGQNIVKKDNADFPVFASWERRPAILVDSDTAIALLEPDGDWVPVDRLDVFTTSSVVPTREEFEERFSRSFGSLNIPDQYLREGQV